MHVSYGTCVFGGHVFRACAHFSSVQCLENSSKMEKKCEHFVGCSKLLLLCTLLRTEVIPRNAGIFAYPIEMFSVKLG